jgi:predicted DNA-binding protein (UPF0251 family)
MQPERHLSELVAAVDSGDPATALAAVAALRRLLEELEALHVRDARAGGMSWEEIAGALGVTRQSVHKKHARRIAGTVPDRR